MIIQTVKLATWGGYRLNGYMDVPDDPRNADYQRIQEWIAAGNTPEPADLEPQE